MRPSAPLEEARADPSPNFCPLPEDLGVWHYLDHSRLGPIEEMQVLVALFPNPIRHRGFRSGS